MLWTESRVEEEECGDDIKKYVAYGNNAADEAAKERRVAASVAPSIVEQWIRCYGLAEKSLHRMATLLVAVGDGLQGRETGVVRQRADDTSAHAKACIDSGHMVPQKGLRQCHVCKQVAPANGCAAWLRSNPCPGQLLLCGNGSIARHARSTGIHIRGQDLHASHRVHWVPSRGFGPVWHVAV